MSYVTRVLMGFLVLAGAFMAPVAAQAATHTVAQGESLFAISQNYGISLDILMKANGTQDSLIFPGQLLYVPDSVAGSGLSYTVQPGDSLYLIGQKFSVSYQEIMSTNGLSTPDINAGMSLYIPTSGAVAGQQPGPQGSRSGNLQRPTAADVDLLARLITAEADAEPYEGKVAVGAVVLNRVMNPNFPKSISDVINQYDDGTYQFEPVMNGWINRPASAEAVKAANDALNGWDPTKGAVYFFATYVKSAWLWARPLSKIIGDVAFTY